MSDVTGSPAPSIDPSLVTAIENLLHAGTANVEAAAEKALQEVTPVINTTTALAASVEPAVAAIDPPVAAGIAAGVAVLNALEAMNGWLGLIPEGTAKQGIQTEIANVKALVS